MLPLVRVGAAVSADVVTSTKLFVMRYNITSLASARLLATLGKKNFKFSIEYSIGFLPIVFYRIFYRIFVYSFL